jgi:16S rRNA (cytosine967-C5)-methyltransferase
MSKNAQNSSKPENARTPKNGARYVAARSLQAVFEQGLPLDQALAETALFKQLEGRDRAFARLIAATVLRRLGQIDAVLAPFLKKAPTPYALAILRTGAAQILFLNTPPHAAVGAAVALLKRSKKTINMAGMANAVLRRVSEQGEDLLAKTDILDNIPKWLRDNWMTAYGEPASREMAETLSQEPPLDLSVKENPQEWAEKLDAEHLPGGTLRRQKIGDVTSIPGFKEGAWWVQDISASLPVKLLGNVKDARVLDLCAAPGGKTMQLAALGAEVVALDKNTSRIGFIRENLKRTNLNAEIIAADAANWRDPAQRSGGSFDHVLLDAPCTATGTFRRRPDVLHRKKPVDVDHLTRVQERLFLASARHVKKGGTLIYCVCSLQTREGEDQVAKFLKNRSDFRLIPVLPNEVFALEAAITPQGCVRMLPGFLGDRGGVDGFFIARFTRC